MCYNSMISKVNCSPKFCHLLTADGQWAHREPVECAEGRPHDTVEHAAQRKRSREGSGSPHVLLFSAPDVQSCSFSILTKASVLEKQGFHLFSTPKRNNRLFITTVQLIMESRLMRQLFMHLLLPFDRFHFMFLSGWACISALECVLLLCKTTFVTFGFPQVLHQLRYVTACWLDNSDRKSWGWPWKLCFACTLHCSAEWLNTIRWDEMQWD